MIEFNFAINLVMALSKVFSLKVALSLVKLAFMRKALLCGYIGCVAMFRMNLGMGA